MKIFFKILIIYFFIFNFTIARNRPSELEYPDEALSLKIDVKCGFPSVLQNIHADKSKALLKLQNWRQSVLQLDSVYYSESGRFKIHYDKTGIHAIPSYDRNQNGTADYLEFVAKSFERAWQVEIDSLGFNPPPDSSGNPRQIYPVYCKRRNNYGETYLVYELENREGANYVTEIEISTRFDFINYPHAKDNIERDSLAIAITAAHEFNHALQSGYNIWFTQNNQVQDLWFIESSATFMEELIVPDANDYVQYLHSYFINLDLPLDENDSFGTRDYGKVVLPLFLGEKYGRDITRKIWQEIENQPAIGALDKVLKDLNPQTSLLSELSQLAGWLYFTGNRAVPGKYFADASEFPSAWIYDVDPVVSPTSEVVMDSLPRYAMKWYQTKNQVLEPVKFLLKILRGTSDTELNISVIDPDSEYSVFPHSIAFNLLTSSPPDTFAFCISNGPTSPNGRTNFRFISTPESDQIVSKIYTYPQPLIISDAQTNLTFNNLPPRGTLNIFTSNGILLKTIDLNSGNSYFNWNLKNDSDNEIGSGVYLYSVKSDQGEQVGKFVVIQ